MRRRAFIATKVKRSLLRQRLVFGLLAAIFIVFLAGVAYAFNSNGTVDFHAGVSVSYVDPYSDPNYRLLVPLRNIEFYCSNHGYQYHETVFFPNHNPDMLVALERIDSFTWRIVSDGFACPHCGNSLWLHLNENSPSGYYIFFRHPIVHGDGSFVFGGGSDFVTLPPPDVSAYPDEIIEDCCKHCECDIYHDYDYECVCEYEQYENCDCECKYAYDYDNEDYGDYDYDYDDYDYDYEHENEQDEENLPDDDDSYDGEANENEYN